MGRYSIKDLEKLSNIKAHTIRVWEQRYGIIEPKRTATNIRYYDDADLRLVLNISFLNRNGQKISHIAEMTPEEIRDLVINISDSNLEFPNQVNALVIAMVNLNEERFEKIISTNTLQFGFEKTMLNIVYPFLARIGILWQTGSVNPAHEHFITNLIRQKLVVAIDGQIAPQNPQAKKYILFLPEGEMHELSLLFAAYVIKSRHNKAIYLGQSLPLKDVEIVSDIYQPDYIMSIITGYPDKSEIVNYVKQLKKKCPGKTILLSGYQALQMKEELKALKHVEIFEQIVDIIHFVDANSELPFQSGQMSKLA
ncbi:MAG: MerR family transcriptional regulator [Bacteroidia bacterium]|nr:MerR family transcriptional regulator [Bacteroidia bacterium]